MRCSIMRASLNGALDPWVIKITTKSLENEFSLFIHREIFMISGLSVIVFIRPLITIL